jgi:hypothetical protein
MCPHLLEIPQKMPKLILLGTLSNYHDHPDKEKILKAFDSWEIASKKETSSKDTSVNKEALLLVDLSGVWRDAAGSGIFKFSLSGKDKFMSILGAGEDNPIIGKLKLVSIDSINSIANFVNPDNESKTITLKKTLVDVPKTHFNLTITFRNGDSSLLEFVRNIDSSDKFIVNVDKVTASKTEAVNDIAPAIANTHCSPQEKVIFSCSTGKKIVSVCASTKLTSSSGYVQYRFGLKGTPELQYPELTSPPSQFVTGGTLTFSGGGGAYMRFAKGSYGYVVYTGIGKDWEKSGIAIENNGKVEASLVCEKEPISELGPDFFTKFGILEDQRGFEIP